MTGPGWNRVAWPEGMFLVPQHLQQLDAGAEARLGYHMRLLDPFHWGLIELSLDEQALAAGQIAIQRLSAVLPDGTIVMCPGGASIELRKFDPTVEQLCVYVGIRQPAGADVISADASLRDRHARYWIRETEVGDEGAPAEKTEIPFLFPNVRVFISGEEAELDSYDLIKLVEIEATGNSSQPFQVRTRYVPPLLKLQAWPALHERVESLTNQMLGKLRIVAARRDSLVMLDTPRLLLGYTLGRMAPVLRHLLSTGHTHPFHVYSALVEIAASMLALQPERELEFPRYDHENLEPCFTALLDLIHSELEHEFKDRTREVPLRYSSAHHAYAAPDLSRESVDPRNAFFLAVKSNLEKPELVRLVTSEAKLGALSHLEFMVKMAVRGASVEHLQAPPIDVGPKPGFEFFRIDARSGGGAIWKRIADEASFGLSLGAVQDADVRLFIVTPEA